MFGDHAFIVSSRLPPRFHECGETYERFLYHEICWLGRRGWRHALYWERNYSWHRCGGWQIRRKICGRQRPYEGDGEDDRAGWRLATYHWATCSGGSAIRPDIRFSVR